MIYSVIQVNANESALNVVDVKVIEYPPEEEIIAIARKHRDWDHRSSWNENPPSVDMHESTCSCEFCLRQKWWSKK